MLHSNVRLNFRSVRLLTASCFMALAMARFSLATDATLANAIERQEWDIAEKLLADSAQIAVAQPDGMTALHWAVFHKRPKLVSLLLSSGASVDDRTRYDVTPLSIACMQSDAACAALLAAAGADVNRVKQGGETPLMTASRNGNSDVVKILLKQGAKIDATDKKGQTALMWAAAEGNGDAVQVLIEAGADLKRELKSGFNAMMFASREGKIDVVRRLLDAGVDVNAVMGNQKGQGRGPRPGTSALMLAIESGHFELALYLVERGADPNDQRSEFTPLHALSWVRKPASGDGIDGDPSPRGSGNVSSLDFVRKLVAAGADVNARLESGPAGKAKLNMKGATPFLLASKTADLPFLKALLELGADPKITNVDGCTALLAASGIGTVSVGEEPGTEPEVIETIEFLLAHGLDINAVDHNLETVMHGAAYRAHTNVAELLAQRGSMPSVWNHKNKSKWTPMTIAQGSRPGSVKPDPAMIAVLEKLLK
jgi:uncharacterized protein